MKEQRPTKDHDELEDEADELDVHKLIPGKHPASLLDGSVALPRAPGKLSLSSLVESAAAGQGRAIPRELRRELERALGQSLDAVRLYDNDDAGRAAQAIAACAFASGNKIFFADRVDLGSSQGRRLLAHEVAHTVQAGGHDATPTRISDPDEDREREADAFADAFAVGRPQRASLGATAAPGVVFRTPMTAEEVENALESTRRVSRGVRRMIAQRLRALGDLSLRIHYLDASAFRAQFRAYTLRNLQGVQLTAAMQAEVDAMVDATYGYSDNGQIYLNRERADTTNPLHEAIHLIESQAFVDATEAPTHPGRPGARFRHRTAFHEAVTSYFADEISRESRGAPAAEDYSPEAIEAVRQLARAVGNDTLMRAYMTGNMTPLRTRVHFDSLLTAFYNSDWGGIPDALNRAGGGQRQGPGPMPSGEGG